MALHVTIQGFSMRSLLCYVGMLSPGELQRLAFARVLYHKPALAVMDEPISALDAQTSIDLLQTVKAVEVALIVTSQPDSHLCSCPHLLFEHTLRFPS